jgi:hypothetical protein
MKKCIICKENKPLSEYYNHSGMKDGKLGKCKTCTKSHTKQYIQENKEYKLEYDRQYHQNHREILLQKKREYYQQNKEKYFVWQQTGLGKFKSNIRGLVYHSLKRSKEGRYKKGKKTEEVLGCSLDEFIIYLQSIFTEGMTLENHGQGPGYWNIDHIIPLSSAKTEEEIYKLGHYTNLQPLWFEDNMKKFNH